MDIKAFIIAPNQTVEDALKVIDQNGKGIVFVCDDAGRALACLTDGDVRRYLIHKGELTAEVMKASQTSFHYVHEPLTSEDVETIKSDLYRALPVLDSAGVLRSIRFKNGPEVVRSERIDVPVVMMAGGKGTRLYPYTQVLPKPLIPIGDVTVAERIFRGFSDFGCNDFYMIVNHKGGLIKSYFQETNSLQSLSFVDETEPLGTGGGLKLLDGKLSSTFFLTNCDVLLNVNFSTILEYHRQKGSMVTMVCATQTVSIPYGTVDIDDDGYLKGLHEKPVLSFLINTGIYVLEPGIMKYIPKDTCIHITDVIERCAQDGNKIGTYLIASEQWSDMGHLNGLNDLLRKDYHE